MQFPLTITFKILTLSPQLSVTDATGTQIGYVRQKLLALKESVTVFADDSQSQALYNLQADRIIDFNANYSFTDGQGGAVGSARREGLNSMWRAHYLVSMARDPIFEVRETSAWVRLADNLLGQIPLVGMLGGYFFHPVYEVGRIGGGTVLRMTKRPALLETDFLIEQTGPISPDEQVTLLLSLMMIVLLERARG